MQLLSCIFEDTYIFQFVDSTATPFPLDLCIFMLKLSFYTASFHVYSRDSSSANNIVYTLK